MDELFAPITSVLPNGLTVITIRTGREGIIGGEILLRAGAAHAAALRPEWEGLPHFIEHQVANGASRNYGAGEANRILSENFYLFPNANTGILKTRYFTSNAGVGYVLKKDDFWNAFAITADTVFFPEFDDRTLSIQKSRVLEEIHTYRTEDSLKFFRRGAQMWGADYLAIHTLGTADQVNGYTRDDCLAFHHFAYVPSNMCMSFVGDVLHQDVLNRVQETLQDVSNLNATPLPLLKNPSLQDGEFRFPDKKANTGQVQASVSFSAANTSRDEFYPTTMAADALSLVVKTRIQEEFGLYTASFSLDDVLTPFSAVRVGLASGQAGKLNDALHFALDLLQDENVLAQIADNHCRLVGAALNGIEISQPKIECIASNINSAHMIGDPLLSRDARLTRVRNTTPEQVAEVIRGFCRSPAFLDVQGHPDALDSVPSIDAINAWRAVPAERSGNQTVRSGPTAYQDLAKR